MGALIDTSIFIEAERGRVDLAARSAARPQEQFFVSVITASELLHGVWRARDQGVRARRSAFVEAVLQRFPLLDVDVAVARIHAQIWAQLTAAGTPIGQNDLWLAATCIAKGLTMVTANTRNLARVPGLRVETW